MAHLVEWICDDCGHHNRNEGRTCDRCGGDGAVKVLLQQIHHMRHGIGAAYYANSSMGYLPHLECLCGFRTTDGCITWQEAGEELDNHLEKARMRRNG